ncbi:hypothetical protein SAMN03159341_107270 [Paenibacillus sp. 1_12]|uniref:hypothetical protein n=1 Tax=Paenibacillus sp. 1_12 TaxID=1566278 RepID=UPI0008E733A2|nr:hypothetical protein [Paenibacillus sp. 1_12]SFL59151.1 hypothetical protein SAMN03159341_107270 [Paenibacillus sp. 1_12]
MKKSTKLQFLKADTLPASICRVRQDSKLTGEAHELEPQLMIGNRRTLEIYKNGLPLAFALEVLLPDVEVMVYRDRVSSQPVTSQLEQ